MDDYVCFGLVSLVDLVTQTKQLFLIWSFLYNYSDYLLLQNVHSSLQRRLSSCCSWFIKNRFLICCSIMKHPDPLRSSGTGLLRVPGVRTKHGEAAFSYYELQIWNKLQENCRSAPTLTSFKSRLWTALRLLFISLVFFFFFLNLFYFSLLSCLLNLF